MPSNNDSFAKKHDTCVLLSCIHLIALEKITSTHHPLSSFTAFERPLSAKSNPKRGPGKNSRTKLIKETSLDTKIFPDGIDFIAKSLTPQSTSLLFDKISNSETSVVELNEMISFCPLIFDFPELTVSKEGEV